MALSKRLLALYQMVRQGAVVADIGCDHALLSIALVENGICDHVYACDLRTAPLAAAEKAVSQAGLQERIFCCKRNGLSELAADVDTVVIAGMGYETIKAILEAHPHELKEGRSFIIQSNTHVEELRRWISAHHYTIVCEDLVSEDHFYEIICFTCKEHEPYEEMEQRYGVFLPQHPLFSSYCIQRLRKVNVILDQLPSGNEKRLFYEQSQGELKRLMMAMEHPNGIIMEHEH